jgi:peptidase E
VPAELITSRRPDPRREIHLIPKANQLSPVDQFTDIVQSAFHEHDLVQIALPDRVSKIPPDFAWIGS